MAKSTARKEAQTFADVRHHYQIGFNETDRRATGKNRIGSISFDEADELFRSWIDEENWPYDALIVDPRVFTFIFEKTSRLLANKPKGHLTPRRGTDMLKARINNALLDYQWDIATKGGTMLSKWALMDMNARKYGAAFGLATWRFETNKNGDILHDNPEFDVLNNRDVAHDLTATSIEEANWFQVRQYVTLQDLKAVNDASREKPTYKNLDELMKSVAERGENGEHSSGTGDGRGTNWVSRNRSISGLETDPYGQDQVFQTVEIVTEYRKDRWITFAEKHGIILRDIENPYNNNELPIVMLKYYAVDDDLYGLSEIEPVKGLQKGINALLCQYLDEINQNLYKPIAVGPGVRQHTLEWGKGARWMMNDPFRDFRLVESNSNAAAQFNSTYSVMVAAMMNALGQDSLGVSNTQPFQTDKTATEVKALQLQRNARDNFNQNFLADSIRRQYMLWNQMNAALLFAGDKAEPIPVRISGKDAISYFQSKGLSNYGPGDSFVDENAEAIMEAGIEPTAMGEIPEVGVEVGGETLPKLELDEEGDSGVIYLEPSDMGTQFDFHIDVESMVVGAAEEKRNARNQAITLLATNPNVMQMLVADNVKPKFKDLFVQWLEDLGFAEADRYFEEMEQPQTPAQPGGGAGEPLPQDLSDLLGGRRGRPTSPNTLYQETAQGNIPGGIDPNIGGEARQNIPFIQNPLASNYQEI